MNNNMLPTAHKILKVVKETQAEYTFRVQCDTSINHGQFFMLSIPKVGEAPISVSGKGDGWVEFTIRKVGKLTQGFFGLREDDTLFMRGPYGNAFPIDEFKNKHLAVISGGTGLAPVKTMLNHFYDNPNEIESLHLISGFKNLDAVLFRDELSKFEKAFTATYTLDRSTADGFKMGFVTDHIPQIPLDTFDDYNIVIVGPPMMMDSTAKKFLEMGVEPQKIWVSFERKMSCAVGKCGHCKIDETYVCLEGPVFNYTKAIDLLD